jgi:DNA-binding transcriptional regulator YhcF (GntR family)
MSAAADGAFLLTGSVGAIPLRTAAVLDAIKRAILAGELRPGQGLVEADLARRLGVSKTPVREALKTLAGAGLVTMSPYRGATVRAIDADTGRAIYDMRLLLEPEAVRRAVRRAQDEAAGSPAAWPTGSSTAPCTWIAATRCWSGPWTTCATRPRWCRRRPGSGSRPGGRRPVSTGRSWPRPRPATPTGRPGCSPPTSGASRRATSRERGRGPDRALDRAPDRARDQARERPEKLAGKRIRTRSRECQ